MGEEESFEFVCKENEKFSKYTILEKNGITQDKNKERMIGELLRHLSDQNWIETCGFIKSKSGGRPAKGRPAIEYKARHNFEFSMKKGYICENCKVFITFNKEILNFCPKCGIKMEDANNGNKMEK